MIRIRPYGDEDAQSVGILIADTFSKYNLAFVRPQDRELYLGPFRHARSSNPMHQEAIGRIIRDEMVFVAEADQKIVGVLRGRPGRLASLFVLGAYHRRGIGRQLVARFEEASSRRQVEQIKVAASLFAVPFYLELGYVRTTGIREMVCFQGPRFPYQPMKKRLVT